MIKIRYIRLAQFLTSNKLNSEQKISLLRKEIEYQEKLKQAEKRKDEKHG